MHQRLGRRWYQSTPFPSQLMKKLFLFAALVLVLAAAFLIARDRATGVALVLTNVGADPLRSLTVHVKGRSYSLGDLAPGSTKSITVNPTGESDIELAFSDARRLKIDCYFESGYEGEIVAKVTAQEVVEAKVDVHAVY
jgi:hypothetical protein